VRIPHREPARAIRVELERIVLDPKSPRLRVAIGRREDRDTDDLPQAICL
jgi:hypothetical protein